MMKRGFAGSVGSPMRIRVYRRVARDVKHDGATTFTRGGCKRAHQCFCQPEWTANVCRKDLFEILALRIREQWKRRWSECGSVVDKHVETTQLTRDLDRHRIDVVLDRDVPDDPVSTRVFADNLFDAFGRARHECHACASA